MNEATLTFLAVLDRYMIADVFVRKVDLRRLFTIPVVPVELESW